MTKLLLASLALAASLPATAGIEVIYGRDNREDIYEVKSRLHLQLARSTAGMVPMSKIVRGARAGTYELKDLQTLERGQNVCASEKFSDQLLAPMCSGFLVGPDLLVTAGHCYKSFSTPEAVCQNFAWMFDYHMASPSHDPSKNIPAANVYRCKEVVKAVLTPDSDYAIIRLDRAVTGRQPLRYRQSGKVSSSSRLVVIGHPSGLPTKVAGDGRITFNSNANNFSTTLDTFHGNSGSAVFNAAGQVEGILIQGKNDYRPSIAGNLSSCKVVNVCDDRAMNCEAGKEPAPVDKGEVVFRMEVIAAEIRAAQK
jgi:V8-like Glu-specific endopeptidase